MRSTVSFFCALSMLAGSASASTIGVTLVSDVSYCRQGFNDNVAADSVCSSNGSGTVDDWGAQWSTAGGTSANLVGVGSTARTFAIDAAVAADDGGADIGQGGDGGPQVAAPVKRRTARVTTCRCGDPQPETEQQ